MARYEHLPVYKLAMETGLLIQEVVRKFSRYNKYSIGIDLRAISRRIIQLIVRANSSGDNRLDVLRELVESCEMLKTMLIFAKESTRGLSGPSRHRRCFSGQCWRIPCFLLRWDVSWKCMMTMF
ncbi:MAG: hypothetical protein AVO38_01785 [delta proteobacterium ML8_D]|nr:MAG: hypothetical protein AVO38_01785 [delta proteobacterium ML8_D]